MIEDADSASKYPKVLRLSDNHWYKSIAVHQNAITSQCSALQGTPEVSNRCSKRDERAGIGVSLQKGGVLSVKEAGV